MVTLPDRPDEAPSQRRRERKWLPVLGVLALIGFVTAGASGVGDAVSRPVVLGGIVRVDPVPGWVETARRQETGVHELLVQRGVAGLYVAAIDGAGGTAEDLADAYVAEGLHTEYAQVTIGDAEPATLDGGIPAVRFGYVGITADGVTTEGVVVTAVGPRGDGVVFDGFAPEGELAGAVGDLREMIEGAEFL